MEYERRGDQMDDNPSTTAIQFNHAGNDSDLNSQLPEHILPFLFRLPPPRSTILLSTTTIYRYSATLQIIPHNHHGHRPTTILLTTTVDYFLSTNLQPSIRNSAST